MEFPIYMDFCLQAANDYLMHQLLSFSKLQIPRPGRALKASIVNIIFQIRQWKPVVLNTYVGHLAINETGPVLKF